MYVTLLLCFELKPLFVLHHCPVCDVLCGVVTVSPLSLGPSVPPPRQAESLPQPGPITVDPSVRSQPRDTRHQASEGVTLSHWTQV